MNSSKGSDRPPCPLFLDSGRSVPERHDVQGESQHARTHALFSNYPATFFIAKMRNTLWLRSLASERCIYLVCSPPHIHVLACGQSRILKQGTHILAHEQALADTLAHHARTVAVAHALSEQLRTQDEGELDVPFVLFFTSYVIMVVRYCAMPITPSLRQ